MTISSDAQVARVFECEISELFRAASTARGESPYCVMGEQTLTIGELDSLSEEMSVLLARDGIQQGSRVMVSVSNSTDSIVLIFALLRLRAVWAPINPRLRGASLSHMLEDFAPSHIVVEEGDAWGNLAVSASELGIITLRESTILWRADTRRSGARLYNAAGWPRSNHAISSSTRAIMYTSGTTGPPKGVEVTDLMWRVAALGCLDITDGQNGDIFYLWEPLYHIGGAQVLILPLIAEMELYLARSFNAERFWEDVSSSGATHVHYLGGILQELLKRPADSQERSHRVRIVWGAGATGLTWREAERRFGVKVHECYGMTETSSIVTANRLGPEYGIGVPLPWFDVELLHSSVDTTASGELLVAGKQPGLITPGYWGNKSATSDSQHGKWWRTGDSVRLGLQNELHFLGRLNDSVRRRGENVSAWQLEGVFNLHPLIKASAMIGVPSELGEQEIKIFLVPRSGANIDMKELLTWARSRLPGFQVPRYISVVPELPLTPSRRIAKKLLATTIDDAFDTRTLRLGAPAVDGEQDH